MMSRIRKCHFADMPVLFYLEAHHWMRTALPAESRVLALIGAAFSTLSPHPSSFLEDIGAHISPQVTTRCRKASSSAY